MCASSISKPCICSAHVVVHTHRCLRIGVHVVACMCEHASGCARGGLQTTTRVPAHVSVRVVGVLDCAHWRARSGVPTNSQVPYGDMRNYLYVIPSSVLLLCFHLPQIQYVLQSFGLVLFVLNGKIVWSYLKHVTSLCNEK